MQILFLQLPSRLFQILLLLFILSCSNNEKVDVRDLSDLRRASPAEVEQLIEQFILAENGSVIDIAPGFYSIATQLILDNKDSITIKGSGMDHTILSFKSLKTGGEGIRIVGNHILLEDFAVYDAPGDGLKAQHCDGITFRRINATWTNGDKSKNGTYALYPVQCKNVLVDQCKASHSRDAGIYVGQSENIIVKNCTAFGNVAGIEIENSSNAEVFDNLAYNNTGGILVFNLPGLPVADGANTKIYRNEILENNHSNFATPVGEGPNGNTVTMIPPGSGIIALAAKNIEIFDNKILRNKTVGIAIANYQITGFPAEAAGWSPYSYNVYVHDNEFERPNALPDMSKELGKLVSVKNAYGIGKSQDIIYDGIWDERISKDIRNNPMNICIEEAEIADLHFTRFLFEGEHDDLVIKAFRDYENFACKYEVKTDVHYLTHKE